VLLLLTEIVWQYYVLSFHVCLVYTPQKVFTRFSCISVYKMCVSAVACELNSYGFSLSNAIMLILINYTNLQGPYCLTNIICHQSGCFRW